MIEDTSKANREKSIGSVKNNSQIKELLGEGGSLAFGIRFVKKGINDASH